jgi:hypothetical protein
MKSPTTSTRRTRAAVDRESWEKDRQRVKALTSTDRQIVDIIASVIQNTPSFRTVFSRSVATKSRAYALNAIGGLMAQLTRAQIEPVDLLRANAVSAVEALALIVFSKPPEKWVTFTKPKTKTRRGEDARELIARAVGIDGAWHAIFVATFVVLVDTYRQEAA